jgi:hypothetical protein
MGDHVWSDIRRQHDRHIRDQLACSGDVRSAGSGAVLSFTATDPSGASCSGALRVTVQHDQKPGNVAIDSGQFFNSAP